MDQTTSTLEDAREVVYFDGGRIYKAQTPKDMVERYLPDEEADPIYPFRKFDGKRYFGTVEFKSYFGNRFPEGITLERQQTCPHVNLWIGMGALAPGETQNYDLYFNVDNSAQLRAVAEHYGLPYPLDEAVTKVLDTDPITLSFRHLNGKPIVLGGVKFIDGKPSVLKLYTYRKVDREWDVWMLGVSYYDNGKCWEKGGVYHRYTGGEDIPGMNMRGELGNRKAEMITSERADGRITKYVFNRNDPLIFWEGHEQAADGSTLRIKRYESSLMVRRVLCRVNSGPTLDQFDLCPDVPVWLGRAFYDDSDENEVLFAVTDGVRTLDAVAAYYGLPVPYGPEQKAVLDTKPELYRARHYDLNRAGEGNFVPVIVGSVTFMGGRPVRLLLYALMRPWDFDKPIRLPEFSR